MANLPIVPDYDILDVVQLAYTALQQDAPETSSFYINQILNIMFGYLTPDQRREVETFLAEKKYLPDVKIEVAK
tara:strand:- start:344 stop:565 length:222 start_codon:yes stop_codon:yes gene_type:complete